MCIDGIRTKCAREQKKDVSTASSAGESGGGHRATRKVETKTKQNEMTLTSFASGKKTQFVESIQWFV